MQVSRRVSGPAARLLIALGLAMVPATRALALDPDRALSQFVRESWGFERGFVGGVVRAIAETPDGHLWLGTEEGLVRFDGTAFTLVAESDVSASGAAVLDLVVDGPGDLWIRRRGPNVQRLSKGRFENALWSLSPREEFVMGIASGRNGTVLYAGRFHGIARHADGRFQTIVPWAEEDPVRTRAEAPDGRVWVGTEDSGLFSLVHGRLTPGPSDLARDTIAAVSQRPDGVWIATRRGLRRWNGRAATTESGPRVLDSVGVRCMLQDRDGNLWLGTTQGLVRVGPDGEVVFDRDAGRVRGAVTAIFEDREGSLWIGGATGIARLREGGFTAFARGEGLPGDHTGPVYVDTVGRTWFAPVEGGLYWLRQGRIQRVTAAGLDRDIVYTIAGGGDGVWVGRRQGGLTRLRMEGDTVRTTQLTVRDGLAAGSIVALCRSRDGTVWAGTQGAGVSRVSGVGVITYTVADGLASNIISSIAQTVDGTVWLATPRGLSAYAGGRWRTHDAADGLPPGAINVVLGSRADALWAGTTAGLMRIVEGRAEIHPLPNVLRDQIVGLAEDARGALWVATSTRILQVPLDRLQGGIARDGSIREFDEADGLRSLETTRRERSLVVGPDGRIWLSTTRGLAVADPARLPSRMPAIAGVRAILVDGVPLDPFGASPLRIPPNRERVVFELAGVSLSFPQHVRLRYRLDGIDRDWSPATTARDAIYTRLAPGPYRLRLMSTAGDGRWREATTAVSFVVEPAMWQTTWFRVLAAGVFGAVILAAYRVRTRQLTRHLHVRFEERLQERTRIAQELHDTLLQGVLSVSMQLHSAIDDLPADTPNRAELEGLLLQMSRVSDEGRVAVRGLRTPSSDDLDQAFCFVQQEYASRSDADFEVTVEGQVRDIHPLIRDEVYRIGREALVNAFRHAKANRIVVEIEYGRQRLRLHVSDDGCGIDPDILHTGRDGHWGLPGMRERAQRIGGQITLASRPGAGTEVELVLPASVAFAFSKEHDHG